MTKIFALMLLGASTAFAAEPAAPPPAPPAAGPVTETVTEGDKPVLEYRHGDDLFKPYVVRLFSPAGVNVVRDQVPDHPHHHGLMFAVAVDGVDFWAETKTSGRMRDRTAANLKVISSDTPWVGIVRNELAWLDPAGDKPLAREERSILVYRREGLGATLLTWQTRLEPAEGKPSIKLSGSHYFGLGKVDGEVVRGEERLTRGRWCACSGEIDGKPVTVAMFDAPANPRPALWFTMPKAFGYLSATLNLHKEPLTVEAGKPLTLTYGVAVWDGKVKADEIEKLYTRWLELVALNKEKK
jgi:hypothetical protein